MALLLKDGLLQVRLPQADVDRFREWAEKHRKTTASEVLRGWVYEAMDSDDKRSVAASGASVKASARVVPVKPALSRQQRRLIERASAKKLKGAS